MMTTIVEDKILHPQAPDWACAIDENIQLAVRRGLKHLCCVANVARTTGWVNQFVCAVRTAQAANPKVEVRCGLKAELLNQFGALDLPRSTAGADYVYLAMRQFPLGDRCYSPAEIRKQLRSGDLDAGQLITALVEATRNAMLAHPGLVIAEMFSILPLVGLDESMVTDSQLRELAQIARLTGASIEVDELWQAPSLRTTAAFDRLGVPILFSTASNPTSDAAPKAVVLGIWEKSFGRNHTLCATDHLVAA